VSTHEHFDHVLGSSRFAGAAIYGAPEVAEAMTHAERLRVDALGYGADAQEVDPAIAALRPPEYRGYATAIDLGETTARVSHPRSGHTDHDLIVVVDDERTVVFCGDLVEESADPAVDDDSDPAAWAITLDRVLDAGGHDAVFVPGHGAVVDADFVRRQQDWLRRR
jgi:glyoxylase-like metal-dependent hydrolase (beta-lactamase superfamily II)